MVSVSPSISEGQRPATIPAWASGPGNRPNHSKGLKARPIIKTCGHPDRTGLQPSFCLLHFILGRLPQAGMAPRLWRSELVLEGLTIPFIGRLKHPGHERLTIQYESRDLHPPQLLLRRTGRLLRLAECSSRGNETQTGSGVVGILESVSLPMNGIVSPSKASSERQRRGAIPA